MSLLGTVTNAASSLVGGLGKTIGGVFSGSILRWVLLAVVAAQSIYICKLMVDRTKLERDVSMLEAEILKAEGKAQQMRIDFDQRVRLVEHEKQRVLGELDAIHEQEKERAEETITALRADIDADRLRLRSRFTCPTSPKPNSGGGLPVNASTKGGNHEAAGLLPADAEFLIRHSLGCDIQIRSLQRYIREVVRPGVKR